MLPVCGPIVVLDPPQLTNPITAAMAAAPSTLADPYTSTPFRAKDSLQRIRAPLLDSIFACVLLLDLGLGLQDLRICCTNPYFKQLYLQTLDRKGDSNSRLGRAPARVKQLWHRANFRPGVAVLRLNLTCFAYVLLQTSPQHTSQWHDILSLAKGQVPDKSGSL